MIDFDAQVVFGDHPEVRIQGDLDVATASKVGEAVAYALGTGCPDLVIDLRDVAFCDSAGLASLLEAKRRAGSLRLRSPSETMRRALESTGLDQVFHITT